jgi:hypothetical protein
MGNETEHPSYFSIAPRRVMSRNVVVRQNGNAASVTTISRMVGEFYQKPIENTGAETVS